MRYLVSIFAVGGLVMGCALSSSSSSDATSEAPILNGTPSLRRDVVLLAGQQDEERCTGTLIRPDVVLTAAHCVPATNSISAVYVGYSHATPSNSRMADGAGSALRIRVIDSAIPSFYVSFYCPHAGADVALLRLEAPVPNATIAEIADATPAVGEECEVFGYGQHNFKADAAAGPEWQWTSTSIGEQRSAKVKIATHAAYAFSAAPIDGQPQHGDSGGPIFCGGKVAGTTSCYRGTAYPTGDPTFYGDLQTAKVLIATTLKRWSAPTGDGGPALDAGADAEPDASHP